jgi:hypothetical protein
MFIKEIKTSSSLINLKKDWISIYEKDQEAQFFSSWDFIQYLIKQAESKCQDWCILALKLKSSDTCYKAFFPLRYRKFEQKIGLSLTEFHMLGNYMADYTGLICDPDHEMEILSYFAFYLSDTLGFKWLNLDSINISERRLELFLCYFSEDEFTIKYKNRNSTPRATDLYICPYILLPKNLNIYLKNSLSRGKRWQIKKMIQKAKQMAIYPQESTTETYKEDINSLLELWRIRWADSKEPKAEQLIKQYRLILEAGFIDGVVHLMVLKHESHTIAVQAGFVDHVKRQLLIYIIARDLSWNRFSAGLLLHRYHIEWAITQGLQVYDFLRGNELYKYSLGATDHKLRSVLIARHT